MHKGDILFEWDKEKNRRNIVKHRISFEDASVVFKAGPLVVIESTQHSHQEMRQLAIGQMGHKMITIIFTKRHEKVRIISARSARENEKKLYRDIYGGGTG